VHPSNPIGANSGVN